MTQTFGSIIAVLIGINCQNLFASDYPYTVIQRMPPAACEPILKLIQNSKDILAKYDNELPSLDCNDCYYADVNNDGIEEWVFCYYQGSGGYLDLLTVQIDKNGIVHYVKPPRIEACTYQFRDELFVKMNGKTYVCTTCTGQRYILLYQNGTRRHACDRYVIGNQREYFKTLCSQKQYTAAYKILDGFLEECGKKINPQTALWIRNDLAYGALASGFYGTARDDLAKIQTHPEFKNASPLLRKAVTANEKMLENMVARDAATKKRTYDARWLLEYQDPKKWRVDGYQYLGALQGDDRTASLLAALTCSMSYALNLRRRLSGDERNIKFVDNRYIIVELGDYNVGHCCLWFDTQQKVGAAFKTSYSNEYDFEISSRDFCWSEVPEELIRSFINYRRNLKEHYNRDNASKYSLFYGRTGMAQRVLINA